MRFSIDIRKEHLFLIALSVCLLGTFAYAAIEPTRPWHPMQQIAINDAGIIAVSDVITVTDSLRVGIGTETPAYRLHIHEQAGQASLALSTDDLFNSVIHLGTDNDGGGSARWGIVGFDHSDNILKMVHGGSAGAFEANTKGIMIDPSGNVGIGITTPAQKLDVVGNIRATGNVAGSSVTGSQLCFGTDCRSSWASVSGNINTVWFENTGILLKDGATTPIASCSYTTGTTCTAIAYGQTKKENGKVYTRAWTGGCSGYCNPYDSGWVEGFYASVDVWLGSANCKSVVSATKTGVSISSACPASASWN